jgi:hypothetical protein
LRRSGRPTRAPVLLNPVVASVVFNPLFAGVIDGAVNKDKKEKKRVKFASGGDLEKVIHFRLFFYLVI